VLKYFVLLNTQNYNATSMTSHTSPARSVHLMVTSGGSGIKTDPYASHGITISEGETHIDQVGALVEVVAFHLNAKLRASRESSNPSQGIRDTLTTPAHIRQITEPELGALLELYRHLNLDEAGAADEAHLASVWTEICANKNLYYFGAEVDGQLVSTCTLTIIPNLTRMGRPYGLIENVVTHADYRKRGLGMQTLHHALAVAWEHNCYKVMLLTGSKREETLRFYENVGFKRGVKTGFVAYPE
jgi:GNAT superfamily N-acetyltransferase